MKSDRTKGFKPGRLVLRLALLGALAGSLHLFFGQYGQTLLAQVNRPVQAVIMESSLERVSEADIKAALASHLGYGFFGMDVQEVRRELEELPWVDQAHVRRVWPDALALTVTEEVAIARWGKAALLNQYAETFEPGTIDSALALPSLWGPEGEHRKVMEQYQRFSQVLAASGLRIQRLSMSPRGSWELEVDSDVVIRAGRDQVVDRLQRFMLMYERKIKNQMAEIESVDLRYRNGMAVRSRDAGQPDLDERSSEIASR